MMTSTMRVTVASSGSAVDQMLRPGRSDPQMIVLWERCDAVIVDRVTRRYPEAIVVAGVPQIHAAQPRIRGSIRRGEHELVGYYKFGSDSSPYKGVKDDLDQGQPCPVWLEGSLAVGVLVCMDVDDGLIRSPVIAAVRESGRFQRLICVPSCMFSGFRSFESGEPLGPIWRGVNILFCNFLQDDLSPYSFITDRQGNKVVRSRDLIECEIPNEVT